MSRFRWPVLFLIFVALVLCAALQRPAVTSAQEVSTPTNTPQPVETVIGEATPTPLVDPTLEATPTPEPTATPTPLPTPVLWWDAVLDHVNIAAGGTVTVPLRLHVEQAAIAQLNLSALVDNLTGFNASIMPDTLQEVPAGASIDLVLTVNADAARSVGEKPIGSVTADDGEGHSAQLDVFFRVAWPSVITAEFDPKEQPVDPGATAVIYVTVVNRDTVSHASQPRAYMDQAAPFAYKLPKLPEIVVLRPGQELQYKFTLRPQPGVPAGARGKVVFEAYLASQQTVESVAVTSDQAFALLTERYGVEVSADPAEQQPAWSETASYTLFVTNTGSIEGAVDWTVSNGPEHFTASAQKPETLPYLKPGEATQIKLEVDPVFAGWYEYFNTVTQRFHAMTDEDKQQFSAFVRDHDITTATVKLGDASAEAEVVTRRPERPDYQLPAPVTGEAVASPAGHGPHAPDGLTCGACHSTHASPMSDTSDQDSQLLLASTTRALCDTCHDGTGSIYNVEAGLIGGGFPGSAGPLKQPGEPEKAATGFLFATRNYLANKGIVSFVPLNPKHHDVVVPGAPAVSAHPLEQHAAPSGGNGLEGTLVCTSCHDPHGTTSNARLLSINFGGLKIEVPFQAAYSPSPEEHASLISGSVDVCRACHVSLDNHGALEPQKLDNNPDLGKPWDIFQARSAGWLPLESEGQAPSQHMVCLTCHAAHGSRTSLPGHFEKLMRDPFVGVEEKYGNWCAACHDL